MKIKIIKYNMKRSSDEYSELVKTLTSKNYQCFDALGDSKTIPDQDEFILESDFLFDNQLNTETMRLFDWREISKHSLGSNYYLTNAVGYYIDFDSKLKLDDLRNKRFKCGYCEHQTNEINKPTYCDKCLGSEYLKESDLFLTILLPVSQDDSSKRKELHSKLGDRNKAFKIAQENAIEQRAILEIERRKKQAKALREKLKEEIKLKNYEVEIQACLLENNLPIDDIIFYSHTQSWSYGWRSSSETKMKFEEFREKACHIDLPELNGARFVDLLSEAIK
jgi:hypothetical protein